MLSQALLSASRDLLDAAMDQLQVRVRVRVRVRVSVRVRGRGRVRIRVRVREGLTASALTPPVR